MMNDLVEAWKVVDEQEAKVLHTLEGLRWYTL